MAELNANTLVVIKPAVNTPIGGLSVFKKRDSRPDDPTELREYVVVVKRGYTIDKLEYDLRRDTSEDDGVDSSIVPDRKVAVANHRDLNNRMTHFMMTWDEARALRRHPEVMSVELEDIVDTQIYTTRTQNFNKVGLFASNVGSTTNYGLYRCNFTENVYGASSTLTGDMTQNLDGTGVDVVIMDVGVVTDHPEWEGPDGRNRFVEINWYTAANVAGSMPVGYYDDPTDGHGTTVASVIAGKTYGWATNANIYSLRTLGSNTIAHSTGLDLVRQWHENKPINPKTGFKNPTIINASWGVVDYIMGAQTIGNYDPFQGHGVYTDLQVWDGNWRGNAWSSSTLGIGTYMMPKQEYGLGMTLHSENYVLSGANCTANIYVVPGYNGPIEASVEACLDSGIIFVVAPGNNQNKCDGPDGPDWETYANIITAVSPVTLETIYYARPSTPWANGVVTVGAVDSTVYQFDSNLEQRASYSHYGTAVDIYAPGTGIVGATSPLDAQAEPYYANASYSQESQQGTSFSAPQVAGVAALYCQLNPGATPAQFKQWLNTKGSVTNAIIDTGSNVDYANNYSLSGGPNKFLYNPFNKATVSLKANGVVISNTVPSLRGSVTAEIVRPSNVAPEPPPSTYSVFFNGSSYLTVTNNSLLAMGTSDFTAEGWLYFTQMISYQSLFDMRTPGNGPHVTIFGYGVVEGGIMPDSGNFESAESDLILPNTWYHVALTRNSGTMRLYVDGQLKASATGYTSDINNQDLMYLGTTDAGDRNRGYLSNFRLIDGTALYTGSSFTVPTLPLGNVAGTICLAAQSSTIIDSTGQMTLNTFGTPTVSSFNPIDNP